MMSTADTGASDSSTIIQPGRGSASWTSEVAKMIEKPTTAACGEMPACPSAIAITIPASAIAARAHAAVRRARIKPVGRSESARTYPRIRPGRAVV
jgi:hypothetical protein